MPFINEISGVLPLAVLAGQGDLTADGSIALQISANLAGSSTFFANGTFVELVAAASSIAGVGGLTAVGRVEDEPNRFGSAGLDGFGDLAAAGRLVARAKAIIAGSGGLIARDNVSESPVAEIAFLLTIADLPGVGRSATYSARILADGVSYPIRGYSLDESDAENGVSLTVALARPSQRAAILAAESFTFDVYDNGTWKTQFESGRRTGANFGFAWADDRPGGNLSISTAGPITQRLQKSPTSNLTIYDPAREEIDASHFEGIIDENGFVYEHQLEAISNLRFRRLLNEVLVNRCGFDAVVANLPDDPIPRADFSFLESYSDGLNSLYGAFRPLTFVRNNTVYVHDSTVEFPAGFEPAAVLNATQYRNAQFQIVEETADGYLVEYLDNEREFDYTQTREVAPDPDTAGTEGAADYSETQTIRTYTDYFKFGDPVPVRTEKTRHEIAVSTMVDGFLTETSRTVETITFDAKLRLKRIEKTKAQYIPSATPPFPLSLETTRTETTTFEYRPDIKNPRREILHEKKTEVRGLVVTDVNAPAFGRPFRQDFYEAWQGGNITGDGQTIGTELIYRETETTEQNPRLQNEIRFHSTNFMTYPPNVGNDRTDARGGDPSTNAQVSAPKQTIVYRDGITAKTDNARLKTMAGGNFRQANLKALAKRRLNNRQVLTGTVELKGLNWSLGRGAIFKLLDPKGVAVGTFLVEGRRTTAENLGTREQRTSQVLTVVSVKTDGPTVSIGVTQPGGLLLNAGGVHPFTLPIECRAGYAVTAQASTADVTVWAKLESADAFQNVATSPLDLSAYAGQAKTIYFEVRIDALAADGDETFSILVKKP